MFRRIRKWASVDQSRLVCEEGQGVSFCRFSIMPSDSCYSVRPCLSCTWRIYYEPVLRTVPIHCEGVRGFSYYVHNPPLWALLLLIRWSNNYACIRYLYFQGFLVRHAGMSTWRRAVLPPEVS